MQPALSGFISGFIATGPMTLAMMRMHQALPKEEKSPLAPAIISDELTRRVGPDVDLSPGIRVLRTVVSHFGYGAAMGAVYSQLQEKIPGPSLVKGTVYGVAVWAGSYAGWAPSMDLRVAVQKKTPRRNALVFAAHLVWGACLGWGEEVLRRSGQEMLDGARKAPEAE